MQGIPIPSNLRYGTRLGDWQLLLNASPNGREADRILSGTSSGDLA